MERQQWFFSHHGRGKQAGTFLSALAAPFARCRWWLVGWVAAKDGPRDTARQEGKGVSPRSPLLLFSGVVGLVSSAEWRRVLLSLQSTVNRARFDADAVAKKKKNCSYFHVSFFGELRCSSCRKKGPPRVFSIIAKMFRLCGFWLRCS